MIHFMGTSHAARHLRSAAVARGNKVVPAKDAQLIFVAEDTPTDAKGRRNLKPIRALIKKAQTYGVPIVLTSQVPPGFTRSLGIERIWHQPETLRMKDARKRAFSPEYIAVGGPAPLPPEYLVYLWRFGCPILRMGWEEAEMSKIAVNMMLAFQVDATNTLAAACKKVGADWLRVANALRYDRRIGPRAYLEPGRWQASKHLLRDHRTLLEILK